MTEWINYHSHNRHLFVPPTQGVRPMTDHRPAARSAIRGLIQLLTDHQPRRQPRDFIGEAMQFHYRETRHRRLLPMSKIT
jgi:hypothetical protein